MIEAASFVTQEHHRRPRSIGGTSNPANISYANEQLHRHWHTIVGNMNAYQICNLFNKLKYKPENVTIICKFINGSESKGHGLHNSKNKHKIELAWESLFGDMDFKQIIEYVNSFWLDPSYHFYLITKETLQ